MASNARLAVDVSRFSSSIFLWPRLDAIMHERPPTAFGKRKVAASICANFAVPTGETIEELPFIRTFKLNEDCDIPAKTNWALVKR